MRGVSRYPKIIKHSDPDPKARGASMGREMHGRAPGHDIGNI